MYLRLLRLSRHAAIFSFAIVALVIVELPVTMSALSPPVITEPAPEQAPLREGGRDIGNPARIAPVPEPIRPPLGDWLLVVVRLEDALWRAAARELPIGLLPVESASSYFEDTMVVSLYGHPGVPFMGRLGNYTPNEAAQVAREVAQEYAALLPPGHTVVPALHLIVDVAQNSPQPDGTYLYNMPLDEVDAYVEVAREEEILLFLDVQVGWADVLPLVQRLEGALQEPFVHLALDPEFATRSQGLAPGAVIGTLDEASVNEVQAYLASLVRERRLPDKILVLHQFLDSMLTGTALYDDVPEVEIVVDMDGFGPAHVKIKKYLDYAQAGYQERMGIKLFYQWDVPLMTPGDVLALDPPPNYVIYQ